MNSLPQRVLAVGAHPDDIELLCAGTLARFIALGSAVRLTVICRGDKGGPPDTGIALRRQSEAIKAAQILGALVSFLGMEDARVADTSEMRDLFTRHIRETQPDLILTHNPDDYHADHVCVSELVTKCSWFAASPGQRCGGPLMSRPPAVFYMDSIAAMNFEPTHFVNISDCYSTKQRMLHCHHSQLARSDEALKGLGELMEAQARLRGIQCGVRYAEAFKACSLWGRCRSGTILP